MLYCWCSRSLAARRSVAPSINADFMKRQGAHMATETNTKTGAAQAVAFDPVDCYKQMVMARTINETLKARKTQGRFPFYIGAGGHEALAGGVAALRNDDWLAFYYRDLAGWLQRTHDPVAPIRAAYSRTTDPMTGGRNMP